MTVAIACDHGAVEFKDKIKARLTAQGIEVVDFGTNDTKSVDYPDYAFKAAQYCKENGTLGIVMCKTGNGMAMCANKVKGIRCALCLTVEQAALSRTHNDANMLALGANMADLATTEKIVEAFLTSEFEGGRHANRVNKIIDYENKHYVG